MSRPLRLEFAGAVWYVTSRGNEKHEIFRDDSDREQFLSILDKTVTLFRWRLLAYVLMDNHYHLIVETVEPTLSRGMRQLNGLYSQDFNRRHQRTGHLFQGRFKSTLVEKGVHLLELCQHVVMNPVRAGLVQQPEAWRWSSYRASAGGEKGSLGVPKPERQALRPEAGELFDMCCRALGVRKEELLARTHLKARERNVIAWVLRSGGLQPLSQIGDLLGVGTQRASVMVREGEALFVEDAELRGKLSLDTMKL